MTTKKQRAELESALGKWLFKGIEYEWAVGDILVQVAKDWREVVGGGSVTSARGADLEGLAKWQGQVLDLIGVGTAGNFVGEQRVRDAAIVMSTFSGAGEDTVMGQMGLTLANDILRGFVAGTSGRSL